MLVIYFTVHTERRGKIELKEYVVSDMAWKLKRIAQAIGAEAAFLKGEFFAADYVGRNLLLHLTVDETKDFGDQNRIKAYKAYAGAMPAPTQQPQTDEMIPF